MDTQNGGFAGNQPIRWIQRHKNWGKTLQRLETACRQNSFTDLELAGLIKMFEFTLELT